jgi:ethanolamine kinase
MLYRFIRGAVTSPADLRREDIWRAVARRLAEWHAIVPCLPSSREPLSREVNGSAEFGVPAPMPNRKDPALQAAIDNVAPGKLVPNVWTVMQKWIYALPIGTDAEKSRQANLQKELTRLVAEFSNRPGLGENSVSSPYCHSETQCAFLMRAQDGPVASAPCNAVNIVLTFSSLYLPTAIC